MRILGIDPGIGRLGWGIIDDDKGKQTPVIYDCFETGKEESLENRIEKIYLHVSSLIQTYAPDAMAIEELFFNTNAKTALVVGQARGVVLLTASQHKLPLGLYTPQQIKIAVTGYGKADKRQVGEMVKVLLKLSKVPTPDDTADALAIALTYAFSQKHNSMLG